MAEEQPWKQDVRDVHERLDSHHGRISILEDRDERRQTQVKMLADKLDKNNDMTEAILAKVTPMVQQFEKYMGFKAVTRSAFNVVVGASVVVVALTCVGIFSLWVSGAFHLQVTPAQQGAVK